MVIALVGVPPRVKNTSASGQSAHCRMRAAAAALCASSP